MRPYRAFRKQRSGEVCYERACIVRTCLVWYERALYGTSVYKLSSVTHPNTGVGYRIIGERVASHLQETPEEKAGRQEAPEFIARNVNGQAHAYLGFFS